MISTFLADFTREQQDLTKNGLYYYEVEML
jgi:hypothetical protein